MSTTIQHPVELSQIPLPYGATEPGEPSEYLRERARELLALAAEVDELGNDARIVYWTLDINVTEAFVYRRLDGGVDQGEIVISAMHNLPQANMLSTMRVGETVEHDFTLGNGFPLHHYTDTLIGRYQLVAKLPGHRAVVRSVPCQPA